MGISAIIFQDLIEFKTRHPLSCQHELVTKDKLLTIHTTLYLILNLYWGEYDGDIYSG